MTWVKMIAEQEATGRLKEVYREIAGTKLGSGRVPNVIKCMSLRPEALSGVWNLNMSVTFGASTLGRVREEMIATSVSAVNHCHY
jgi:hypothetical protein